MGSDNYPDPEVTAAVKAASAFGDDLLLVGKQELLEPMIADLGGSDKVKIIHAPEVLEMTDKPSRSARGKALNSMAVGMDLLKTGEGDAFVTAGNTGGAMANGLFRLGRIRGVKRPALTALLPVVTGGHCVVLDIGANTECKPEFLRQFAIMGSIFAEKLLDKNNPRVGLLSNGEEAGKGNDLVKATYPILEASEINFIGNVEGKELFGGEADVVVTDGFTGNVMVKVSEAVSKMLIDTIRKELTSSIRTSIGALLSKPAFDNLKKLLDPSEVGAAPLLGLKGLVFVGHGRSDSRALVSAIRVARQSVETNLYSALEEGISRKLSGKGRGKS
jgi:glycerol-3-phosphate acyltransferase PlsX